MAAAFALRHMEVLGTPDEEQPESGVHIDVSRGKPDVVVTLASRFAVVGTQ